MSQDSFFEELVNRHYRRVHFFFRSYGFSKEDSRDLTQIVFVRLHVGMKDYQGGSEWAYIKTTADRVRLNEIRYRNARSRGPTIPIEEVAPSPDHVDERALGGERPLSPEGELLAREKDELRQKRSELLKKAIDELPPRMKNCITMRIYGNLKYREIAAALGVSLDTVKRLIYEAKAKLKEKLRHLDDSG